MTLIVVPITGCSVDQIRREMLSADEIGADLIELRLDLITDVTDEQIRSMLEERVTKLPVILTIRPESEGGDWEGSDEDRIERIIKLGPFVDYIDIEFDTWLRLSEARSRLTQILARGDHISTDDDKEIIEQRSQCRLILSKHDFSGRPPALQSILLQMLYTEECRVPKMAWRSRSIRDNFEAFELMRHCRDSTDIKPEPEKAEKQIGQKQAIVICIGPEGLLSRVLAKKFGAFATYAALSEDRKSAPGQPTITALKELYRWDSIDEQTEIYGVIGDPVTHSLSPCVHNAAFQEAECNAVYMPLKVDPSYEAFKAFMVEVQTRQWMDIRGFSVTHPHKENALKFIQSIGGSLDEVAARIGAVNTILVGRDGTVKGYNTDCSAALEAIRTGMHLSSRELVGLEVSVLGAGGVARAIVAGLTRLGAQVTIYNRTTEKGKSLAEHFSCDFATWERRSDGQPKLIINCTSVGMSPEIEATPFRAENLHENQVVFDTIYNPLKTKFLHQAVYRGCTIINGLSMFALQARAQFELWTKKKLPTAFFQTVAETGLE